MHIDGETVKVEPLRKKIQEIPMRWFGHIQRRGELCRQESNDIRDIGQEKER